MSLTKEQLLQDYDSFSFYLGRYREILKSVEAKYGTDSKEAVGWQIQVRATEDSLIDIGGQLGRMPRSHL